MVARLSSPAEGEGSQASEFQRALFQSFRCPERMRGCGDTGDAATVRLLRHGRLGDHRACLLVGESGSGKSALAREAAGRYERVVWLAPETLDGDNLAHLERGLDLRHPLVEVLRAVSALLGARTRGSARPPGG